MNNKGFTLVELLLSIVVLALIMVIAIPSVDNVSEAVRKNQRDNNIKQIEIAASKYAFDTGETIIFVDKLVTEGYIESDEDGNIIDNLNNSRLNCYVVEMEKVSDYYNATFIDGKNYDNNGECDLSKLKEENAEVNIEVLNNGITVSDTDAWVRGTMSLRAYSDSVSVDCETNKCVWSSSSGASSLGTDSINLNNISGLLNTSYTFQMTVYDNESSEIKRYKTSVNLKIDNEAPIIYENEISTTDKFIYTSTKKVKITASDGKGSGIAGYYLGLDNGQTCYSNDITYQAGNTFTISSNGDYLICVKDNTGNIRGYNGLKISYIQ